MESRPLAEVATTGIPVVFEFSIAPDSRGASFVEREHATEPLASVDAADWRGRIAGGEGDDVAEALVVALGVVVLHEVVHDGAQMTLAERDVFVVTDDCQVEWTRDDVVLLNGLSGRNLRAGRPP